MRQFIQICGTVLQLNLFDSVFIHQLYCEVGLIDEEPRLQFVNALLDDLEPLLLRHILLKVSIKH